MLLNLVLFVFFQVINPNLIDNPIIFYSEQLTKPSQCLLFKIESNLFKLGKHILNKLHPVLKD